MPLGMLLATHQQRFTDTTRQPQRGPDPSGKHTGIVPTPVRPPASSGKAQTNAGADGRRSAPARTAPTAAAPSAAPPTGAETAVMKAAAKSTTRRSPSGHIPGEHRDYRGDAERL